MALRPKLAFSRGNRAAPPDGLLADGIRSNEPNDDLRQVLEALGARVETALQLHRLATNPPTNPAVEIGAYLQDLSGAIVEASAPGGELDLRFDCGGACHLSATRALAAVLIVVELVTNAVRHAHPARVDGAIWIECRRAPDGRIRIAVHDDGVGLPEGFDPMKDGSLGLKLVRILAAELGAQLDFSSTPLGLSAVLQVPTGAAA